MATLSGDRNDAAKSAPRVTEPTVMVGLPVSFLAHPARLRLLPSNSGDQNWRVEQWKRSTPASTRGRRNWSNSSGDFASLAL